jgi:uncharacterized membrane protein YgcG
MEAYAIQDIPNHTQSFYVNDFANVLTEKEKNTLMEKAVSTANKYDDMQIVVTTITSLEGETIEDYAYRMFKKYAIGKHDMGILLLFSLNDRKIMVHTGKKMKEYVKDEEAAALIEEAKKGIPKEKIGERLLKIQSLVIDEAVNSAYPPTPTPYVSTIPVAITTEKPNIKSYSEDVPILEPADQKEDNILYICMIIAMGVIIIALTIFITIALARKSNSISKLNNLLKSGRQEYSDKIGAIRQEYSIQISELERKLNLLQSDFDTLENRYSRACTLFPNVDASVTQMIENEIRENDMAAAKRVDDSISEVIALQPNRNYVSKVKYALDQYYLLPEPQKKYVTADIAKLRDLYSSCEELQQAYEKEQQELRERSEAKEVSEYISSITSGINSADRYNLSELEEAQERYDSLSSEAQSYIDPSLFLVFTSMLSAAQSDQMHYQHEQEQEQAQSQSSYDFTSFSGMGGSSDPGSGASGDF